MISYLKYYRKLKKLQKAKANTIELYDEEIKAARKNGKSKEDIEFLHQDSIHEELELQEEIDLLITNYLRNEAQKLYLPNPDYKDDESWKKCRYYQNRKVLTKKGALELRSLIRREKRQQMDNIKWVMTLLIGFVGAATGLLAIILQK